MLRVPGGGGWARVGSEEGEWNGLGEEMGCGDHGRGEQRSGGGTGGVEMRGWSSRQVSETVGAGVSRAGLCLCLSVPDVTLSCHPGPIAHTAPPPLSSRKT